VQIRTQTNNLILGKRHIVVNKSDDKKEVKQDRKAVAKVTVPDMVTVPTADTRRYLARRTIAKHALRLDRSSPTVATLLWNEYKLSPAEEARVLERISDMRVVFKYLVGRLCESSNVDITTLDDRTRLFREMEQNLCMVEQYDSDTDNWRLW